MWPFDQIKKREYQRNLDAALVTFLGHATYLQLPPDQRDRVDAECKAILMTSSMPTTTHTHYMKSYGRAQIRAIAMERLGIPPVSAQVSWTNVLRKAWRYSDVDLFNSFHPRRKATEDALERLRALSIKIEDPNDLLTGDSW